MVVRRSTLQRSGDKNVSQTPFKPICVQYGFRFFDREKSKSVASTAKRQRGWQRGKLGSPLPCFASFCRSKRKASAASGTYQALYKAPRRRQATTYLAKILLFIFPHRKVTPAGQVYRPSPFDDSATPPGDHQPSHKPHSTPFLPRKDDPHA